MKNGLKRAPNWPFHADSVRPPLRAVLLAGERRVMRFLRNYYDRIKVEISRYNIKTVTTLLMNQSKPWVSSILHELERLEFLWLRIEFKNKVTNSN